MGVIIVPGTEISPRLLSRVPDLSEGSGSGGGGGTSAAPLFQLLKADVKDPLVRQFIGGLVTGLSPVPEFSVVSTREVQRGAG